MPRTDFRHPGNGIGAVSHYEHRLHIVGLTDLVLRQQSRIEPARAGNARCFHQFLVREAGAHPLVIHFPNPAPVPPRLLGKSIIERQCHYIEAEIGGTLHIGVATKYVGACSRVSHIAGSESQNAAGTDIRGAGRELGLSHRPDQRRGFFLGEDFCDMLHLCLRQTGDALDLVRCPLCHLLTNFIDAVNTLLQEFLVLPAVFENMPKHPVDRGNMGARTHTHIFGCVRSGPRHPGIDDDHVGAVEFLALKNML